MVRELWIAAVVAFALSVSAATMPETSTTTVSVWRYPDSTAANRQPSRIARFWDGVVAVFNVWPLWPIPKAPAPEPSRRMDYGNPQGNR